MTFYSKEMNTKDGLISWPQQLKTGNKQIINTELLSNLSAHLPERFYEKQISEFLFSFNF